MSDMSKDEIMRKVIKITEEITGKELSDDIINSSDVSADTTNESIIRFNSIVDYVGYLNTEGYDDVVDRDQIKGTIYNTIVLILKHYKTKMDYQLVSCIYTTLCEIDNLIDRITSDEEVSKLLNYVLWITYTAYCLSKGIQNEAKEVCFEVDYDNEELSIIVSDIDNICSVQDIICRLDDYYMDITYHHSTDKKIS